MSTIFSRANKSLISRWWWTIDKRLLVAVLVLIGAGIMMVSAASPAVASRIGLNEYHFILRHLFYLVPSLGFMFGLSLVTHENIRRFGVVVFFCAVAGICLTLIGGYEIKGAQRWIRVLGFSIQPSEFLKPGFIILAAWLMAMQKQKEDFQGNAIAAGFYVLCVILLVMQPDMGMTILLSMIWAAQIFLAGFPFIFIIMAMGVGVVGLTAAYFLLPHFQSRVNRFINPESGDTFQIDRALEAFEKGGLVGVGPGEGSVKLTIPDAHADFVFAVAGEEMGFVFVLLLIALYAYILWRGIRSLIRTEDMFTVLAIGGLLAMIGLQALIHMGANVHLLPTKGMTLPFVSYGGSSVIALGITMGMLLGLTRKQT